MATLPANVRPGDLITALSFNELLEVIRDLQNRVTILETREATENPPVLSDRVPSGDIEVNSLLTLRGYNFVQPSNKNTVYLGNVPIKQFATSSDERNLIFTVPDVFDALPRSVVVYVETDFGKSPSLEVRLLPRVQPQGGDVVVFDQTLPLGDIVAGGTYPLSWLVDSQTIRPAVYTFSLVFTNTVGATADAWRAAATLTPNGAREIRPGNPLAVTASVQLPTGGKSANVALRVESSDGGFTNTSAALKLEVGTVAEVSDPRTLVTLLEPPPQNAAGTGDNPVRAAVINGTSGIEVVFATSGDVPVKVFPTAGSSAGTHTFTATIEDAGGRWVVEGVTPPQAASISGGTREIAVTLTNTDTQRSSMPTFLVVKAAHRPTGATADDYVSFVRVPIKGVAL